jgi:hypothetical protein
MRKTVLTGRAPGSGSYWRFVVRDDRSAVHTLLVLWDIDHTLTENHGVNKEIYAYAFELLTGRRAEHEAHTDGRTEPEIMLNMLLLHGIKPEPAFLNACRMSLSLPQSLKLPPCGNAVMNSRAREMR